MRAPTGEGASEMARALQEMKPRWRDGVVVVCGKCGKRGKKLRSWLKKALSKIGLSRRTRVAETKCLGVCPGKKRVAVLVGSQAQGTSRCLAVDPKRGREELLRTVKAGLRV